MTETEVPNETPDKYLPPNWFLSCNVRISAELGTSSFETPCGVICSAADKASKIDISETGDSECLGVVSRQDARNTRDDSRTATGSEAPKVHEFVECKFPYDTLSELRDAIAAALICDQAGELLAPHGSIVVRCPTKNAIPLIGGLLLHVATDLKAALVSVDLEDLDDLGWEFDDQDQRIIRANGVAGFSREEPDRRNLFYGMAVHYFGAQSKRKASKESWNRSMRAIAAILDSHITRSQQHATSEDNPPVAAFTINTDAAVVDDPPLLLYVRNYNKIASLEKGHRLLKRLWNSVQDQRMSRQRVVLLVSVSECSSGCGCSSYHNYNSYPGGRHFSKISPDIVLTITITPSNLAKMESENGNGLTGEVNFRRLKRFLRYRIPHLLTPELAGAIGVDQPFSTWAAQGFKGKYEPMVASAWTTDRWARLWKIWA